MPFHQDSQVLPDLHIYRAQFLTLGHKLPLPEAPSMPQGLLASLPSTGSQEGWPWTTESAPHPESAVSWPKITIVTPSFQQGAFLEETIRSVLLQNYPRLEYIVIDGGSTDDSAAIIERYRPWLSFARVAPDRGQSHAINLGFSLGSGDIFAWLNSDDFYLPGTLRHVADAWRRGAEFFYGDSLELNEPNGEVRYAVSNLARARYVRFAGLVPQPGSFWAAVHHQPLWEEQQCALDYELWIRLLPGLRIRHLRRPLAVARQHDLAKTYNPAAKRRWDEDAQRNAHAHPQLYRPGLRSRLLAAEFRVVQRLWRAWQQRSVARRLDTLRSECRWSNRAWQEC